MLISDIDTCSQYLITLLYVTKFLKTKHNAILLLNIDHVFTLRCELHVYV